MVLAMIQLQYSDHYMMVDPPIVSSHGHLAAPCRVTIETCGTVEKRCE